MGDKKIKILVTIPTGFCFGLQHVTVDLFDAAREWLEPHFLITRWNNGEFEKLVSSKRFDYSFSWLGMFSRNVSGRNLKMSLHALSKLPRLYYDFLKVKRKTKPDVLFFANHHELILLSPVLWLTGVRVVCHMHDPSPAIPFQKKTFAWYGKRVDRFITISNDVKLRLMALGCPEEKITVVHNGINLPAIADHRIRSRFIQEFQWPEQSFIVGITGQMTETKGHEDLLDAFEMALQNNPQLRLVFGGKKLEPLYSRLVDRVREKKLESYVAFSGWVDRVDMFYPHIDIFVLASRHDEGYGLVVAEAMAHGKPVIATKSGGAVEVVGEDGGVIVPKRDPVAMSRQIVKLSTDFVLYKHMSAAAVQRMHKEFSSTHAARNFVEALRN